LALNQQSTISNVGPGYFLREPLVDFSDGELDLFPHGMRCRLSLLLD
jgi:hypothetical protein